MPAVSRETQYNPPVHTEPVLEQEAPAQGAHSGQSPSRGLPEYPRENPLFAEDDEDEQQVDLSVWLTALCTYFATTTTVLVANEACALMSNTAFYFHTLRCHTIFVSAE